MLCFSHVSGSSLRVGDASLYYEVAGNPAGKPLVLLHGGLGSMADFQPILDRLPADFRLIGIDFRGHGKSTLGTAPLTYQQYQADVVCVLDHLGVPSCSLLGFSDGGIVAYRLAARMPARVAAVATVGAQWRLETGSPVFEMLSGLTAEMWGEMFPESVDYYRSVNPAPDFDTLVQAVVGLWTDLGDTGYPNESVADIAAPMLIVRGDDDPLLSLHEAVELQEKVAAAHFANVPFAGHEVHKDAPALFAAMLGDFLLHPQPRRQLEA